MLRLSRFRSDSLYGPFRIADQAVDHGGDMFDSLYTELARGIFKKPLVIISQFRKIVMALGLSERDAPFIVYPSIPDIFSPVSAVVIRITFKLIPRTYPKVESLYAVIE